MNIRFANINDIDSLALINYTSWQETYRGIVDDSYLDAMNLEQLKRKWQAIFNNVTNLVGVTENEDEGITGYYYTGKLIKDEHDCSARLFALYLLKKFHGKGWGRELFIHSMNELKARGINSCCLYVLRENPSVNFYRSFKPVFEELVKVKIGEKEYDEIVMGWNNLNNFKP